MDHKFKKKPIVIEAVRVDDVIKAARFSWKDLPDWVEAAYENGDLIFVSDFIDINTDEGMMTGRSGDWIVKGVEDEIYPVRGSVFDSTYEQISVKAEGREE